MSEKLTVRSKKNIEKMHFDSKNTLLPHAVAI